MKADPREVLYYKKADDDVPFLKWLYSIEDKTTRAKMRIRLDRIAAGNLGNYRPVGDGVNELKIDYGPGYRIYFAFDGQKIVVILCGGDKSSQGKDIKLAKEYWADYKREDH
ncbi:MAG: type II toxin-antitoxin system RelE/ParE family toxin [Deltaproteobacteria bacterium]|nr:type II toxin-antitoxin system RelE/ParE family toxin [Deltaproteobacteria bacterium]MCL5277565.1 type II toxin-antitoxin system RelE/ParE family toxin [Deltaproteobacteria bacterium]